MDHTVIYDSFFFFFPSKTLARKKKHFFVRHKHFKSVVKIHNSHCLVGRKVTKVFKYLCNKFQVSFIMADTFQGLEEDAS